MEIYLPTDANTPNSADQLYEILQKLGVRAQLTAPPAQGPHDAGLVVCGVSDVATTVLRHQKIRGQSTINRPAITRHPSSGDQAFSRINSRATHGGLGWERIG